MLFQEISWIRSNGHKLCPIIKKEALNWYRFQKSLPCYILRPIKQLKKRFRKLPVIIQTLDEVKTVSNEEIARYAGCRIECPMPLINAFAARVNAKQLERLTSHAHVRKIWFDREVKTVLDVASTTVNAPYLWEKRITGKNVVTAVIDTGIYTNSDIENRIIGFKDFVQQKPHAYDDNGHGTHVAGDIASNGSCSDGVYRAAAPDSKLVGVKVLNRIGSGQLSTVIEGVQWCVENRKDLNIRIMNISLGSEATESYKEDPVCQAVGKAWDEGIVVCVAAGNDGPENGTISSPGIHPNVITVGALKDNNTVTTEDDDVADFSSRGPTADGYTKPDILAPGVKIISLRSPKSTVDKKNNETRVDECYTEISGTSMATPVCAGAIAQLLEINPNLTPEEVKKIIMENARKFASQDPNIYGAGALDVQQFADLQSVAEIR